YAILDRYPPAIGRLMRLDPTLMTNQQYLQTYPALAAFLQQYPQVLHNPGFYLDRFDSTYTIPRPEDSKSEAIRLWRDTIDNAMVFCGFVIAALTVLWLIRSLIEHRRWSRISKVQADAQGKLFD